MTDGVDCNRVHTTAKCPSCDFIMTADTEFIAAMRQAEARSAANRMSTVSKRAYLKHCGWRRQAGGTERWLPPDDEVGYTLTGGVVEQLGRDLEAHP